MATAQPPVLHVAATWGTNVIAFRHLARGESFDFAMPYDLEVDSPIHATPDAWHVDPRGAIAGTLRLRGRDEDVAEIGKTSGAFAIANGDYGLLQYGQLGIFFQCADRPKLDPPDRRPDVLVALALVSSTALHLGALGLLRALMLPPPIAKPLDLVDDYVERFHVRRAALEEPHAPIAASSLSSAPHALARAGAPSAAVHAGERGARGRGAAARHPAGPWDLGDLESSLGVLPTVSEALARAPQQSTATGGLGLALHGVGEGVGVGDHPGFPGGDDLRTDWGAPRGGHYGEGTDGARGASGHDVAPRLDQVIVDRDDRCLSAEQIRRVVLSHRGALRACYDAELVRDPALHGGVAVRWSVEPGGTVTSASIASSSIRNARLEGCVLRQVRSWRFPVARASTNVASYPFEFGVGGGR